MSTREVICLGTASQVPTRSRNHHALLLLWDDLGILFDPGEGTQRQMTLAGVSVSQITHIAITHFHGDRKSTRLNSSHLVISYAVFCLKKKKELTSAWTTFAFEFEDFIAY